MAFGLGGLSLGVCGGARAGVAVTGPGCGFGRGWSLGVAGCGCSPLLAEGLVGAAGWSTLVSQWCFWWRRSSPGGGLLGPCSLGFPVLRAFVVRAALALWCVVCVCGARVGGRCGGVCCVRAKACVWCVAGACGCLSSPLWAWFGGSVWVRGLCVVAPLLSWLWGPGVVPRHPRLGSVGGGVFPRCPLCVPSPLFLFAASLAALFPWCLSRVYPGCGGCAVGLGGGREGSLTLARVPSPGVFPWEGRCLHFRQGVTLLYGPSICTRSVQMDLLPSQVLQSFPTPGSGTLRVTGESLRDRRVSCLPQWTVCPTRSPSLGPNRSTCRGECSWSGPLVPPPGRCHRGPLTNGPGRIPPYCVCSGGADTVTGGGPKPLRLGPSPASPVGPFPPAPSSRCVSFGGGFPVSPG